MERGANEHVLAISSVRAIFFMMDSQVSLHTMILILQSYDIDDSRVHVPSIWKRMMDPVDNRPVRAVAHVELQTDRPVSDPSLELG